MTTAKTRFCSNDHNLILEYCVGKSIADFLKHKSGGMAETEFNNLRKTSSKKLATYTQKKIIHCDIKPGNILLKPLEHNRFMPKLADFGLALEKKTDGHIEVKGPKLGTLLYMSPELLRDEILDYGVDIWAYGCTILEMFTGRRPWSEFRSFSIQKLKEVISNSEINQEVPTWLSADAKDFLVKCLEKDPKKRYDANALLNHKFVSSITSVEIQKEEAYEDIQEDVA